MLHKHVYMLIRDYKHLLRHTWRHLHVKLSQLQGRPAQGYKLLLPLFLALIELSSVSKHQALKEQFLPFVQPHVQF